MGLALFCTVFLSSAFLMCWHFCRLACRRLRALCVPPLAPVVIHVAV